MNTIDLQVGELYQNEPDMGVSSIIQAGPSATALIELGSKASARVREVLASKKQQPSYLELRALQVRIATGELAPGMYVPSDILYCFPTLRWTHPSVMPVLRC